MTHITISNANDLQKITSIDIDYDDTVSRSLDDIWLLSITTKNVSRDDIAQSVHKLLTNLSKKITKPNTFYFWYDDMAGQFRFNIVLEHRTKLPFRCTLAPTTNLSEILNIPDSLGEEHVIPWEEIEYEDENDDKEDEDEFKLKVFVSYLSPN